MAKHRKRGDDYHALTREQVAALAQFDRAVNAASDIEVLSLVLPAVLGSRYGGGLRLRGCSARQLRALLALKNAQEWALGHDTRAARAYLGEEEFNIDPTFPEVAATRSIGSAK